MLSTINYKILYDNGQPLCFVGHSQMSRSSYDIIKNYRESELCSLEDIESKDKNWYSGRQFIVILSDIEKKIHTINQLTQHHASFFSLVNQFNTISPTTFIGRGTYIGGFNSFDVNSIKIGDHVIICTHNTLGHHCHIDDFCHLSHHSFFNQVRIGKGTVIGTQVLICPPRNSSIKIAEYCNITSNSRVTRDLLESGTYHSTRLISSKDSRIERIL